MQFVILHPASPKYEKLVYVMYTWMILLTLFSKKHKVVSAAVILVIQVVLMLVNFE